MVSDTRKRFNEEFRRNLDAGNSTFEFEGKTYTTKMAPPPSSGPTTRGRGPTTSRSDEQPKAAPATDEAAPPSPKSLKDWYTKNPDSFPKKYAPKDMTDLGDSGSSAPMQTEAQRVGEARSDLIKQRDLIKKTQPTERTGKMYDDLRTEMEDYKTSLRQQGYKKGGVVKKAKGGSIRGAGIAARGHGKMRMF
jgi:hypothetical protein